MNKKKLLEYLKSEELKTITGWDFSYLDGRWESEDLPWNYQDIVLKYLKNDYKLLDIGTGGGEVLLTFNHPSKNITVTEGYKPNYELCLKKLKPLGIRVLNYVGDELLKEIDDNEFDIVINRHESYNEAELFRILKPNGLFITQQVGAYNNQDLATFFDPNHVNQFPEMTLDKSVNRLMENGFEIIKSNECYPTLKFYDLGSIAYFAKIIEWEFLNFSVDKHFDKFLILQDIINEKGYITSTEHRFMIIAKKKEVK